MASLLAQVVLAAAVVVIAALVSRARRRHRYPPGPPGVPILGNVFDMPRKFEWFTFEKWGKQYNSGLIYLNVVGTPLIVINSAVDAIELFEKRSSIYSDRGRFVMVNELMGWDFDFGFLPYGSVWREKRRMFHQQYSAQAIIKYQPRMTRAIRSPLPRLSEGPDDFMVVFRDMAASIIMSVTYGINPLLEDDPYVEAADDALAGLVAAANAGSYLVDFIPALKYVPAWFPGTTFKRQAAQWHRSAREMIEKPFAETKRDIANGTHGGSVVSSLLCEMDATKDRIHSEDIIRHVAGAAYAGGTDTTVSILAHFVRAMLLHPEVQRKAQEELDLVVGPNRLPLLDDEPNLPYLTAILREVVRWRPIAPLALPHALSEDDEYLGYHLPKGALVIGNVWAMFHDESRYPDPDTFNPDRFIAEDGTLDADVPNPEQFAFGFGRRVCPGRFIGSASVWLTMATLLAAFELEMPTDEHGRKIEPSEGCTSGLAMYPVPFRCVFKPRSTNAETLIRAAQNDMTA